MVRHGTRELAHNRALSLISPASLCAEQDDYFTAGCAHGCRRFEDVAHTLALMRIIDEYREFLSLLYAFHSALDKSEHFQTASDRRVVDARKTGNNNCGKRVRYVKCARYTEPELGAFHFECDTRRA